MVGVAGNSAPAFRSGHKPGCQLSIFPSRRAFLSKGMGPMRAAFVDRFGDLSLSYLLESMLYTLHVAPFPRSQ